MLGRVNRVSRSSAPTRVWLALGVVTLVLVFFAGGAAASLHTPRVLTRRYLAPPAESSPFYGLIERTAFGEAEWFIRPRPHELYLRIELIDDLGDGACASVYQAGDWYSDDVEVFYRFCGKESPDPIRLAPSFVTQPYRLITVRVTGALCASTLEAHPATRGQIKMTLSHSVPEPPVQQRRDYCD